VLDAGVAIGMENRGRETPRLRCRHCGLGKQRTRSNAAERVLRVESGRGRVACITSL